MSYTRLNKRLDCTVAFFITCWFSVLRHSLFEIDYCTVTEKFTVPAGYNVRIQDGNVRSTLLFSSELGERRSPLVRDYYLSTTKSLLPLALGDNSFPDLFRDKSISIFCINQHLRVSILLASHFRQNWSFDISSCRVIIYFDSSFSWFRSCPLLLSLFHSIHFRKGLKCLNPADPNAMKTLPLWAAGNLHSAKAAELQPQRLPQHSS